MMSNYKHITNIWIYTRVILVEVFYRKKSTQALSSYPIWCSNIAFSNQLIDNVEPQGQLNPVQSYHYSNPTEIQMVFNINENHEVSINFRIHIKQHSYFHFCSYFRYLQSASITSCVLEPNVNVSKMFPAILVSWFWLYIGIEMSILVLHRKLIIIICKRKQYHLVLL